MCNKMPAALSRVSRLRSAGRPRLKGSRMGDSEKVSELALYGGPKAFRHEGKTATENRRERTSCLSPRDSGFRARC